MASPDMPITEFSYRGRVFRLVGYRRDDLIFRAIVRGGAFYEIDLLDYVRFITATERTPGCFGLDVGANIGNHSVYFSTFVCDMVLAFEPNPQVLPVLRQNVTGNACAVTIFPCAVGEAPAFGRVVVPESAIDNVGMAEFSVEVGARVLPGAIPVRTIDEVVAEVRARGLVGRVLLVKIDVEGMEPSVLRGALATLEADRPHLFVEARTPGEYRVLEECLAPLGYVALTRWAATPVYHFAWSPSAWTRVRARGYALLAQKAPRLWRGLRRWIYR